MDKRILIAAIIGICLVAIVLYVIPLSVETKGIQINVVAERKVGINLDTDKVYFGTVPVGGSALRNITIANSGSKKRFVLSVEGPLNDWISASQSKLVLWPGENKTVTLNIEVPKNATPGNYTSNLVITAYRTI